MALWPCGPVALWPVAQAVTGEEQVPTDPWSQQSPLGSQGGAARINRRIAGCAGDRCGRQGQGTSTVWESEECRLRLSPEAGRQRVGFKSQSWLSGTGFGPSKKAFLYVGRQDQPRRGGGLKWDILNPELCIDQSQYHILPIQINWVPISKLPLSRFKLDINQHFAYSAPLSAYHSIPYHTIQKHSDQTPHSDYPRLQ